MYIQELSGGWKLYGKTGNGRQLTPDKKQKFIKLLCKVEGKEYKETKEVLNRKIRISDVSLVAKEVLGINIKVEL